MSSRVESILEAAMQVESDARAAFLEQACGSDPILRQRVEQLIRSREDPNGEGDELPGTSALRDTEAGVQIDKYRLLQRIGEGGFGVVFMAEQQTPVHRRVALKIIKPGMDTESVVARFEAERQALALMEHPNIARVFDGGTVEGDELSLGASQRPYFVMELVQGVPITTYCDEHKLDVPQRLALFVDVCRAVQHAHQKGVIHRDIKPSNVMVSLQDGVAVVKVIDFGVAKAVHQRLTARTMFTELGQMIGTPQYMSPEQADAGGLDVDTRSDIYSLGVLLYELLTGSTPLQASQLESIDYAELQRLVREQESPTPSSRLSSVGERLESIAASRGVSPDRLHREIQGDLDWIVMKCLDRDRQRRYDSATALAQDVERYLSHQPVAAGPPDWAYRTRKFLKRHRRAVMATGFVAGLLVIAGAVAAVNWTSRQARRANANQVLANAVDQAAVDLGRAVGSPVGHTADWAVARASRQRIADLLQTSMANENVVQRAREMLGQIDAADSDRRFAEQIENVIITSATHMDLESWQRMERQLRSVFEERQIALDGPPTELAEQIRAHPSADRLTDALELLIATRAMLSYFGGPPATRAEMQPWAEALYAADPDPLRTGIRRLMYEPAGPVSTDRVAALAKGVDLNARSARELSWLASAFMRAEDPPQAEQVYRQALRIHPDDLMLNFELGRFLKEQKRCNEAVRYYMRCTALRPDVSGLWRALGVALRANDELPQSRQALEHAVELQADHVPTQMDLAATLLALDEPPALAAVARTALDQQQDLAAAHGYLGRALMLQQDHVEALKELQRCRELAGAGDPGLPIDAWIDDCRQRLTTRSEQPPDPPSD